MTSSPSFDTVFRKFYDTNPANWRCSVTYDNPIVPIYVNRIEIPYRKAAAIIDADNFSVTIDNVTLHTATQLLTGCFKGESKDKVRKAFHLMSEKWLDYNDRNSRKSSEEKRRREKERTERENRDKAIRKLERIVG